VRFFNSTKELKMADEILHHQKRTINDARKYWPKTYSRKKKLEIAKMDDENFKMENSASLFFIMLFYK